MFSGQQREPFTTVILSPAPAGREQGTERLGGTGVACGQVLAWLAGGSSLPVGPL